MANWAWVYFFKPCPGKRYWRAVGGGWVVYEGKLFFNFVFCYPVELFFQTFVGAYLARGGEGGKRRLYLPFLYETRRGKPTFTYEDILNLLVFCQPGCSFLVFFLFSRPLAIFVTCCISKLMYSISTLEYYLRFFVLKNTLCLLDFVLFFSLFPLGPFPLHFFRKVCWKRISTGC